MLATAIVTPFRGLLHSLEHAVSSWTLRRELDGMDDRMLKDLGISRAQAEFQASHGSGWSARPWHIGPHHDA